MSNKRDQFWELPIETLNAKEWEALCDGCGLCCVNKIEDEDSGKLYATSVACNLLDLQSCQCSDYANRKATVPECIKLTLKGLAKINWLPESCAYVRRYNKRPLPVWHYLISGDRDLVHTAGISMQGEMIHETDMDRSLHYYVTKEL